MAEGKNIEIRLAATGGDQAAAEVKKAVAAEEQLAETTIRARDAKGRWVKVGEEGAQVAQKETQATKEQTEAVRHQTTTTETATAAAKKHADAKRQVTAASVNMHSSLQNVGYQIQDVAVQFEMGTSAARIFAQQGPQLLSGFGPWGVAAGTIIALGAPLAAAIMGAGESAGESKDKVDDLKDTMEDYAEAAKKAAVARDVKSLEDWFDGLDDEEEKIAAVNEQRERELELLIKTRSLKQGVESARRDLRRAEIEADPNMKEPDKIRARQQLDVEEKRAAADEKIQQLRDAAAKADFDAKEAEAKAKRQEMDAQEAARERADVEAAQRRNEERGKIAEIEIPRLQQEMREKRDTISRKSASMGPGNIQVDTSAEEQEIQELQKRIAALQSAAGDPAKNARSLAAQAESAAAKEREQQDQAEKARKDAADAAAKRDVASRAVAEQSPLIEQEFGLRRDEIAAKTQQRLQDQAETEAKKKEADERRREAEAKKKEADERRREAEAGGYGRKAEGLVPKGESKELRSAIQRASDALQNGDQGGEIDRLISLMEQLANSAERRGDKSLARRIDLLEQQIKKNPAR